MDLECYPLQKNPPEIVPGRVQRAWMDKVQGRHPYRCLPLNIANTSGWEILSPASFSVRWKGGDHKSDLSFDSEDKTFPLADFVQSHFRYGVVTFNTGWLFRTPPGWALWVLGPPNAPKKGIWPLNGLVETDWLPYPFTMNWKMTQPGRVRFERGEPFCFVVPFHHEGVDEVRPVAKSLDENHALRAEYEAWKRSRGEFNAKIEAADPVAMKEAWQRYYMTGASPGGAAEPSHHVVKRRMRSPELEQSG